MKLKLRKKIEKKIIELDDKYLFKISQVVENNSKNPVDLYPYAQITRNKIPDDIQNFYISHEGYIGVFDDELKEDDYDIAILDIITQIQQFFYFRYIFQYFLQ